MYFLVMISKELGGNEDGCEGFIENSEREGSSTTISSLEIRCAP